MDGGLVPYFPEGLSGEGFSATNALEVYRLTGSAVPHVHYLAGAFGLPNMALDDNHWHAVIRSGEFYQQYTINAADHVHEDLERPAWFMPFVLCSDADAALIVADPAIFVVATCPIDEDGEIGAEDDTPWTAEERAVWEDRFLGALGLQLPAEVSNPRRLVLFVVALNARMYTDAAPLRPSRVPEA
ncbi:MAG: hypothetical protein GWO24_09110, partial [Akkermansiaceae bacterium]|nr:hypothetical protein [Akkermansiaceae bacterium]